MNITPKISIQEIFMAKDGNNWNKCFHGTIRRETDLDGNPIVFGKIKVKDGYIIASADDQWELGSILDQLVFMILHCGLHPTNTDLKVIVDDNICLN